MAADTPTLAEDLAQVERWLAAPDAGLNELRRDAPFLRSPDQAREFLKGIKRGLEDVAAGRVLSHTEVVRRSEARRRRYSADAAE